MGFDGLFGAPNEKKIRLILFLLLCCKYVCYSVSMPTDLKRPERMEKGLKTYVLDERNSRRSQEIQHKNVTSNHKLLPALKNSEVG